jgi:hypothetical protein
MIDLQYLRFLYYTDLVPSFSYSWNNIEFRFGYNLCITLKWAGLFFVYEGYDSVGLKKYILFHSGT